MHLNEPFPPHGLTWEVLVYAFDLPFGVPLRIRLASGLCRWFGGIHAESNPVTAGPSAPRTET